MKKNETKPAVVAEKRIRRGQEIWDRFRKSKVALAGLIVFVLFVLMAIFADVIVPYQRGVDLSKDILQPPSASHILGTDQLGRDYFARIVHGSRVSLSIGIAAVVISNALGICLGLIAGYFGKVVDTIIMRIMETIMCIPSMLLMLAVVGALGPNLVNATIALTISSVPSSARFVRALILTISGEEYIMAAKSYGATSPRIMFSYILPNCLGPIIVSATMSIASMILAASALSYLGMGAQPPTPEWGNMLSMAKGFMTQAPYMLWFPGICLLLASLAINLAGDGLRDAMDPKLRN